MLNDNQLQSLSLKAQKILRSCGELILEHFDKKKSLKYKDERDIVTQTDKLVENKLRDGLTSLLPEAGFIVEEGRTKKKPEYNWTIDPIDGTKAYAYKLPMFLTQISLLKNDESVLGIIYNPIAGQIFRASRNSGIYLNDKKIKVSGSSRLNKAIINIDLERIETSNSLKMLLFSNLAIKTYRVRINHGFMFPYLFTDAIDAYLHIEPVHEKNKIKRITDLAPRQILAKEAGLRAEYVDIKNTYRLFIAANSELFSEINSCLP